MGGPGDIDHAGGPLSDPHYAVPLYKKAEAARIINVPPNTLRNWAGGPVSAGTPPPHGRGVAAPTPAESAPMMCRLHMRDSSPWLCQRLPVVRPSRSLA
jgi:hypothetical protein